ncbi:Six-hairpin glycosidase-like protein [Cytidiella melzeri]|nr:Six-hairpin glycosidase-like protein [Cytidiella melzeri]
MRFGLLSLGTLATVGGLAQAQCPDYTTFSQSPQSNLSTGPLKLPFMRPAPACRTFNSSSVEKVISDMKARLKDPDLARLFENTFPNTLDTTVKYFNSTENLAFIITGDITAQWLRDTGNQFAHYHSLLGQDKELATLVKAVINNEARYVSQYPYCGAFQPPPESGLAPTHNDYADNVIVNPPVNNLTVFECKYEIDSLCGFLKLSRSYYQATNDPSIMNDNWHSAISQIFRVVEEQSQASFDENFNFISFYNWTGGPGALSPAVNNAGNGEPKAYTGLVGTHHRPSDDLSTFAFLTPANAMLSVELGHLADILDSAKQSKNVSTLARQWSSRIHDAIWDTTLVDNIFAYETNGLGGRYVMDDANVPSLLSLPYLGFLDKTSPAYVATRKVLLSRQNPYYAKGKTFGGIGGPHVDAWNPWPMSQISSIFGTDDDDEITTALYLIANNTAGLGLIHESIDIYNTTSYTRPWFAWANSYFAEMLLDLADRKPHLIFRNNVSYVPGQ